MTGYISSDNAEISNFLNERNTVFLVFANPSDAQIQPLYNVALDVIKNNNPSIWRVLWVKHPGQLNASLTKLFWPEGINQAVVMSLGAGLNRTVKAVYAAGALTDSFDLFAAFSEG